MDCEELQSIAEEGLAFSGRMSALVAHELKNVLAIINENAGLLADLAMLAEKGGGVEARRLTAPSQVMSRQVKRADVLIKDLNRFGHLAAETAPADPAEILNLVVSLAGRLISSRDLKLQINSAAGLAAQTPPFYLANLLWRGLVCATEVAGPEREVEIIVRQEDDWVVIEYGRLAGLAQKSGFPGPPEVSLLTMLGGECRLEPVADRFLLLVPA